METPAPSAPPQGEREPGVISPLYEELLQLENARIQKEENERMMRIEEAKIRNIQEARLRQIEEARIRQIEEAKRHQQPWYVDQALANLHYNKLLKLKKGIDNRLRSLIIHTKYNTQDTIWRIFLVTISFASILILLMFCIDGTKQSLIIANIFAIILAFIAFLFLIYSMIADNIRIWTAHEYISNLNTFYTISGYNLQFMIPME